MTSSTSDSSRQLIVAAALRVLLAAAVALAGGWLAAPPPKARGDEGWKLRLLAKLDAERPELLLIGNSILDDSTNERELGRLLGLRVSKVAYPGTDTAMWYLLAKNIVPHMKEKPRAAAIFFRDEFLTRPDYRTGGEYRDRLDRASLAEEPLLDRLAYRAGQHPIAEAASRAWAPLRERASIRSAILDPARDLLPRVLLGMERDAIVASVVAAYAPEKLDPVQQNQAQIAAEKAEDERLYNFAGRVGDSFLPEIVRLLREQGIDPVFVRTRRRRDAEGKPQPEALKAYIADLAAWLGERRIALIDFTSDERIPIGLFAAGDHLDHKAGKAAFTPLLADRLRHVLPGSSLP